MDTPELHSDEEWPYVVSLLPPDLEETAKKKEALVRRRNIPSASALVRLALAYAVSDSSLKDVAAWAGAMGVAKITGPGLFYRLREAEKWLEQVLAQTLKDEVRKGPQGLRVRVVDATVLTGPGAKGTEFRVHVLSNPATGCLEAVNITDEHGGEGYGRHPIEAGDVVLGDRGYATARGILAVREADAHVVVRLNPHAIRVCGEDGKAVSLLDKEKQVPKVGVLEFNLMVPVPPEKQTKSHKTWDIRNTIAWVPVRVVAARTRSGGVIWMLTTLPSDRLPAPEVLKLYRFRWQIELLFKRLKSLLHMDALPSPQRGPTAKTWVLAKLLAAALAQKLVRPSGPFSPWGYEIQQKWIYSQRLVSL